MRELRLRTTVTAIVGLGATFGLYGSCFWGAASFLLDTLGNVNMTLFALLGLAGTLVGFLVKPLLVTVYAAAGISYHKITLLAGVAGLAFFTVGAYTGLPGLILPAEFTVGVAIALLFVYWLDVLEHCPRRATVLILTLSLVCSAPWSVAITLVPQELVLQVFCPLVGVIALVAAWLTPSTGTPLTSTPSTDTPSASALPARTPSANTLHANTPFLRSEAYQRSLGLLIGSLACAAALLLIAPATNYVVLGNALDWHLVFRLIGLAQLLAALICFLLLAATRLPTLMLPTFLVATPLLSIALFLLPFMNTNYAFAVLLTGSCLHFIVSILMMSDCLGIARKHGVSPAVLYCVCGCVCFFVTYLGEQIMRGVMESSLSRDLQLIAMTLFLIYLLGLAFFFAQNRRKERKGQDIDEKTGTLGTEPPLSWSKGSREQLCLQRIAKDANLSERESEVLQRLFRNRNAPAIAEELFISPNTVRSHIKRIYRCLGVHSRQELNHYFERQLETAV